MLEMGLAIRTKRDKEAEKPVHSSNVGMVDPSLHDNDLRLGEENRTISFSPTSSQYRHIPQQHE